MTKIALLGDFAAELQRDLGPILVNYQMNTTFIRWVSWPNKGGLCRLAFVDSLEVVHWDFGLEDWRISGLIVENYMMT